MPFQSGKRTTVSGGYGPIEEASETDASSVMARLAACKPARPFSLSTTILHFGFSAG
jgi:hypothetical protein